MDKNQYHSDSNKESEKRAINKAYSKLVDLSKIDPTTQTTLKITEEMLSAIRLEDEFNPIGIYNSYINRNGVPHNY